MRTIKHVLALTAASFLAAATLTASPAHAAPAYRADCPVPPAADVKRARQDAIDKPARGADAISGLRIGHVPKGFTYGQVQVAKRKGAMTEYSYLWSDERNDVNPRHRSLRVQVICGSKVTDLAGLKRLRLDEGAFRGVEAKTTKLGDRTVLVRLTDGALGSGRLVGWVEPGGTVVTVLASEPLVRDLAKIVRGVRPA
ncbi:MULTISPECIES: hypothetical protein [unclassified Nonomuraea]|uniref:hypothetical protein n=1 Tax=unclassified Nonomuraea TaxID=2593643 RepID=UPI0033FEB076